VKVRKLKEVERGRASVSLSNYTTMGFDWYRDSTMIYICMYVHMKK
jgi:hypothetical protein